MRVLVYNYLHLKLAGSGYYVDALVVPEDVDEWGGDSRLRDESPSGTR